MFILNRSLVTKLQSMPVFDSESITSRSGFTKRCTIKKLRGTSFDLALIGDHMNATNHWLDRFKFLRVPLTEIVTTKIETTSILAVAVACDRWTSVWDSSRSASGYI